MSVPQRHQFSFFFPVKEEGNVSLSVSSNTLIILHRLTIEGRDQVNVGLHLFLFSFCLK